MPDPAPPIATDSRPPQSKSDAGRVAAILALFSLPLSLFGIGGVLGLIAIAIASRSAAERTRQPEDKRSPPSSSASSAVLLGGLVASSWLIGPGRYERHHPRSARLQTGRVTTLDGGPFDLAGGDGSTSPSSTSGRPGAAPASRRSPCLKRSIATSGTKFGSSESPANRNGPSAAGWSDDKRKFVPAPWPPRPCRPTQWPREAKPSRIWSARPRRIQPCTCSAPTEASASTLVRHARPPDDPRGDSRLISRTGRRGSRRPLRSEPRTPGRSRGLRN